MPVYQFGFYAFNQFNIVNDAGRAGIQLTQPGNTQGVGTPGERLWLNSETPVITTVRVEDDDPEMTDASILESGALPVVVAGSPFGTPGARVDLEYRIILRSNEVPPKDYTFYVVSIGGVNVGLIGEVPLDPALQYTIVEAIDQQSATTLRRYGVNGQINPDIAGVNVIGWTSLFCFTHGTLIETPDGPRLIEDLRVGDLVTTLDNGSQPLRWIGTRSVSHAEMLARPEFRPVRFETGALGNSRPLLVSPQHRMLLNDWRAEVYFGEEQVLIAAKALVNGSTIREVVPETAVTYCHLLSDRHEVILAEGALSESFHPGEAGLAALDAAQREEIAALFPNLPLERRRAAFPIVKPTEARILSLPG